MSRLAQGQTLPPDTRIENMNSLLRNLFGRTEAPSTFNQSVSPSLLQPDADAAHRHQLVQITVRDVCRRSGIPYEWMDCQTLMVSSRRRGNGLYIQLLIQQWDERLLRYACAFQADIMRNLKRFDPKAEQWVHGVSWQFPPTTPCPYTTLPDKSFWQTAKTPDSAAPAEVPSAHFPAAVATPPSFGRDNAARRVLPPHARAEDDVTPDLDKLFAIRDEELRRANTAGAQNAFEATEPSPLVK